MSARMSRTARRSVIIALISIAVLVVAAILILQQRARNEAGYEPYRADFSQSGNFYWAENGQQILRKLQTLQKNVAQKSSTGPTSVQTIRWIQTCALTACTAKQVCFSVFQEQRRGSIRITDISQASGQLKEFWNLGEPISAGRCSPGRPCLLPLT